jgi:hypothetical protein
MNSTYTTFDWHAKGVYVAHDPQGHVLWGTFADNAYSSRSELIRQVNHQWSRLKAEGYVIHAYQPVVAFPKLTDSDELVGMPAIETPINIITPTEMEALLEGSTNQG